VGADELLIPCSSHLRSVSFPLTLILPSPWRPPRSTHTPPHAPHKNVIHHPTLSPPPHTINTAACIPSTHHHDTAVAYSPLSATPTPLALTFHGHWPLSTTASISRYIITFDTHSRSLLFHSSPRTCTYTSACTISFTTTKRAFELTHGGRSAQKRLNAAQCQQQYRSKVLHAPKLCLTIALKALANVLTLHSAKHVTLALRSIWPWKIAHPETASHRPHYRCPDGRTVKHGPLIH